MNWEETLIKSKDIKWRYHVKNTDDGKLDFDLHLPLTGLFKMQTRMAFANGMITMLRFHVKHQADKKAVEIEDLVALFNECGLPEIADKMMNEAMK